MSTPDSAAPDGGQKAAMGHVAESVVVAVESVRPSCRYDIPIPLPGSERRLVWIAGLFPITPDEWTYVMNVLEAMRPGMVEIETTP